MIEKTLEASSRSKSQDLQPIVNLTPRDSWGDVVTIMTLGSLCQVNLYSLSLAHPPDTLMHIKYGVSWKIRSPLSFTPTSNHFVRVVQPFSKYILVTSIRNVQRADICISKKNEPCRLKIFFVQLGHMQLEYNYIHEVPLQFLYTYKQEKKVFPRQSFFKSQCKMKFEWKCSFGSWCWACLIAKWND